MSTTPAPIRSLAAEVRAVTEGHRAFLARDQNGPYVRVVSDTVAGKSYRVTAVSGLDDTGSIVFTCEPRGAGAYRDDHGRAVGELGAIPCKHAAAAARRLERAGIARNDGGRWVAPAAVSASAPAPTIDYDDDPFAAFPS